MSVYKSSKQVLLVICDGLGFSDNTNKNAVKDASTPTLDTMLEKYPWTTLTPGGELVGLPKGVAGNSEVGHMNMGAGRPVRQDLVRINEAIELETFEKMDKFQELIRTAKSNSNRVHLMTLLSDGGVHAHINHLKVVIELLKKNDIQIFLHAFMDGRDTPKTNGLKYIEEIEKLGGFTFASIQGRSIGMDRDRRWEKIKNAYDVMTGSGVVTQLSATDYVKSQYEADIYDEFITPALLDRDGAIKDDDCAFFLNFRPDRAKQISEVFCSDHFEHFKNKTRPLYFLCMSPYIDEEFPEVPILFNRENIKGTLAELISSKGLKQFKIAETEKYAHVTYFFNGGQEEPFDKEERKLISSPRDVATYDLKPEMSAYEVCQSLSEKLEDKSITLFIVNFANPDMVGHTGNYEAAKKAVEHVDICLEKLKEICLKNDIAMLITADHGNCDQMVYEDGSAQTSHTTAQVPFILVKSGIKKDIINEEKVEYALMDIAPTILYLLGIEKNNLMTGTNVFN